MVEFSALEVAALVDIDEGRVRKDVEHGLFGKPRFTTRDLVYFRIVALLGLSISVDDRRRLLGVVANAMRKHPTPNTIALSDVTELKLGVVVAEMKAKLQAFSSWKKRLVEDPRILGGEPVFPNSRTAVRSIGALVSRGTTTRELLEDYPHLTNEDFEFARLYVRAYPKMGRPREASSG